MTKQKFAKKWGMVSIPNMGRAQADASDLLLEDLKIILNDIITDAYNSGDLDRYNQLYNEVFMGTDKIDEQIIEGLDSVKERLLN